MTPPSKSRTHPLTRHGVFARSHRSNPHIKNFDGQDCYTIARDLGWDDILYLLEQGQQQATMGGAAAREYGPPLVSGLDDM